MCEDDEHMRSFINPMMLLNFAVVGKIGEVWWSSRPFGDSCCPSQTEGSIPGGDIESCQTCRDENIISATKTLKLWGKDVDRALRMRRAHVSA